MSTKYIPFFPLKMVAFPGEQVNLHIFEPRYKQLVNECLENDSTFGIPVFNGTIMEYGSEMKVTRLIKRYESGEMDIYTQCVGVFKKVSFDEQAPGKLYAGGMVESVEQTYDHSHSQWQELKVLGKELLELLKMEEELDVELLANSFELAHKLGLSLEQEYDMLQMTHESQRQEYMINHLRRAIPLIREMETAKEKIRMNGHFQHHDPLNF